jgi:hypothetical protein
MVNRLMVDRFEDSLTEVEDWLIYRGLADRSMKVDRLMVGQQVDSQQDDG